MRFAPSIPSDNAKPQRSYVDCEVDGTVYRGSYWVAGKILTVATGKGGHSRQLGAMQPAVLAKTLLEGLAKVGKA